MPTSGHLADDDLELRGADLVLLLLAADTRVDSARDQINGITRLEKLLYLADRETQINASVLQNSKLEFKAYDYGPFSKGVYEAVDLLEVRDLLTEERRVNGRTIDNLEDLNVVGADEDAEYVERCFRLTDRGRLVAKLLAKAHPEVVRDMTKLKDAYAARPLTDLIAYVYKTYPNSTVNSKIRHRFL